MIARVSAILLLVALVGFISGGCGAPLPSDKPSDLQAKAEQLLEGIEMAYKGTSREGTVTEVRYDGQTVTVKTAIFPDTEGIESIKQMRVGLYTLLRSYDPNIKVEQIRVLDSQGNAWVYP